MHKELLSLFECDNTRYITSSLTGEDNERGKKTAKYQTVHSPVTKEVWVKHLKGQLRLGLKPEVDGKCKWACIDIDPNSYKDYSEKKVVDSVASIIVTSTLMSLVTVPIVVFYSLKYFQ